jgi:hypothetical protein
MKKTILTALVVLLAIMAVTCDSFAPDADKEPLQYTEDGRLLVQLTINAPKMSRALTADLAKGGVDYYEVAFQDLSDPTKTYRTSWDYTKRGRIAVPPGEYDEVGKAILFAGRYSDRTLLAVGVLIGVDGSGTASSPETSISPNTTTVTFLLSPLTNDVSDDNSTSTFQILTPDTPPFDYSTANAPTPYPTAQIDGITYPLFRIPKNTATGITATYDVNFPTIASLDTKDGIIIKGAGRLVSSGVFFDNDSGVTVTGTITPITGTVPDSFELTINTGGLQSGLSRLSIEVPVCAINTTYGVPGTWYVRGGMSQGILDAGVTANSLGGAVLLAVGPVKITGMEIYVNWP